MLDQPHNADTVNRLGCAAGIVPFRKITLQRLLGPILRARGDAELLLRTLQVSKMVTTESESALDHYCDVIQQHLRGAVWR